MAPDRAEENGLPPEFGFIARVFRPLAGDGALDLRDDAAVFTPLRGDSLLLRRMPWSRVCISCPMIRRTPLAVNCCVATCPTLRPWMRRRWAIC